MSDDEEGRFRGADAFHHSYDVEENLQLKVGSWHVLSAPNNPGKTLLMQVLSQRDGEGIFRGRIAETGKELIFKPNLYGEYAVPQEDGTSSFFTFDTAIPIISPAGLNQYVRGLPESLPDQEREALMRRFGEWSNEI